MQTGKRSKEYTAFEKALRNVLKISHTELAKRIKVAKQHKQVSSRVSGALVK